MLKPSLIDQTPEQDGRPQHGSTGGRVHRNPRCPVAGALRYLRIASIASSLSAQSRELLPANTKSNMHVAHLILAGLAVCPLGGTVTRARKAPSPGGHSPGRNRGQVLKIHVEDTFNFFSRSHEEEPTTPRNRNRRTPVQLSLIHI
eukprot:TRINITY_DN22086_c0_g1_i2.p1 TRINITY_DN22086_c0_g1~~TRINITY_DN22086_c0_g1_i2.p1  ORF type:complete len:146 (-),score=9.43 TRINITY_DN22086_c0_g1_i2:152-589(-)